MKKSFLIIGIAATLFSSCKKKSTNSFSAEESTGTSNVSGVATRQVSNGNRIPAAGVLVSITINNYGATGLYPNVSSTNNYGSEVYSATTDATGRYSINCKTNGRGVTGVLNFRGFTMANDTAKSAILYQYPSSTNITLTLTKGVNQVNDFNFTASTLVTPADLMNGTAIVRGTIRRNINLKSLATTTSSPTFANVSVTVPAVTVYLEYSNDPFTLTRKMYTTTSDANGNYSFTVNTSNQGANVAAFPATSRVWVADAVTTQDTMRVVATVTATPFITGRTGVFPSATMTQSAVWSTSVKNAQIITYGAFIAD